MVTCHNDGNPANNRLSNLRWGTLSSNEIDKIKHGTSNHGERHGRAKLNEQQVRIIRWLLKNTNMFQKEIGKVFKVTQSHIDSIKHYKQWKHI